MSSSFDNMPDTDYMKNDDSTSSRSNSIGSDDDRNTRPRRQPRQARLYPLEDDMETTPIIDRMNEVTLLKLMDVTKVEDMDLDLHYLDIQLMRVVSPGPTNNTAFSFNRGKNKMSSPINYSRMFLCRIISLEYLNENKHLCYLMETKTTNISLFDKNINYRDNGVITVGTIMRILAPQPITSCINDIPLMETHCPLIVMKRPFTFPETKIDYQIQGNQAMAFIRNGVTIKIKGIVPVESTCSGLFCDKQRVHEWSNQGKGCGCYHMISQRTNLVIDHRLKIEYNDKEPLIIDHFSSTKFSLLYMTSYIPPSVRISSMRMSSAETVFWPLKLSAHECINIINANGGFTLIGWYKKGIINDKTLVKTNSIQQNSQFSHNGNATDVQVDGEINYHIVELQPTNNNFYMPTSDIQNIE